MFVLLGIGARCAMDQTVFGLQSTIACGFSHIGNRSDTTSDVKRKLGLPRHISSWKFR